MNGENLTVGEIVAMLSQFSPDTPVLVDPCEDGFDKITDVRLVVVERRKGNQHYMGQYADKGHISKGGFWAVLIGGRG